MMTLARICEGCNAPIEPPHYLNIHVALERTDRSETQDPIEDMYGDYCFACARSGKAMAELLGAFTKVKIPPAVQRNVRAR